MEDIDALIAENQALKAELARIKGVPGAVSPVAPKHLGEALPVPGVRFAAVAAGVRYRNRTDVMLARIAPGSTLAGVFTTSRTRSAPVYWCEKALAALGRDAEDDTKPLAIVVNAGNANAFTGAAGEESVARIAHAAAEAVGTVPGRVFMASTGVIGEPLPHQKIEAVLEDLSAGLSPDSGADAARAIMTTDTFPKIASAQARIDGETVTISGFAKGSGMIAPDMATMLSFVFTDARIGQEALQTMLSDGNEESFNAVTVDSDTSTSDTLLLAATGRAAHAPVEDPEDPRARGFRTALRAVLRDLAQQVARDGEGASKFIEIEVTGAESDLSARRVAMSVANSPLVKTAFAGEDPNWGRIVMAIGKAGEPAERDLISIRFGDILVAENGWVAASYREEDGAAYMKRPELVVSVDLGIGQGEARVWTCDLTYAYVRINADYRS